MSETTTTIAKAHPLPPLEFSAEQRQMIRNSFLNGASEEEAQVLLEIARLRRLNPLLKQIYFVKRWDRAKRGEVWAAQVGIDGFRALAERTGLYDGQDEPIFVEGDDHPLLAKVRVYRKDWTRPAVGVAYWSEYVQWVKDGASWAVAPMWQGKAHVMLAKCAEALALRKAFPEDMSGLYISEELQAEETQVPPVQFRVKGEPKRAAEPELEREEAPQAPAEKPPEAPRRAGTRTAEVRQRLKSRPTEAEEPPPPTDEDFVPGHH